MPDTQVAADAVMSNPTTEVKSSKAVPQDPAAGGAAPGAAQASELPQDLATPAVATEQPKPSDSAEQGGVQKRISELTRQRREAERRAAEAEAQAAAAFEALQRLNTPTQPDPPDQDMQPPTFETPEQFARDMAAYAEHVAERRARIAAQAQREQEARDAAQRSQQAQQEQVRSQFMERVEQAREKMPDYDDVVNNPDVPISVPLAAAIAQHPQGAEVAYHLGKNVGEAKRIASLPVPLQIAELGALAYQLSHPAAAPTSRAPAPIEPVRGPAAATSPDLGEMSMEEYAVRRMGKR